MALNFAETFLRESGAAQDRSRSMAEMQLRARQFERQMAEQAKQTAIAKMRAETAQDLADAQIEAMKTETELAESADERAAELFKLQAKAEDLKLSNEQFRQKILQGEYDDQNAVLSDEDAALYGVPKGTKVKDVETIQNNIKGAIETSLLNKQLAFMNEQESATEGVRSALENVLNPEITASNVTNYMPESMELGTYEKAKRRVDLFVNQLYSGATTLPGFRPNVGALGEGGLLSGIAEAFNLINPWADIEINAPNVGAQRMVGKYELEKGFSAESINKFLDVYGGKKASETLSPEQQSLREAMINYTSVFGDPQQAFFEVMRLYDGNTPPAGGIDFSSFIPQMPVEGQDD